MEQERLAKFKQAIFSDVEAKVATISDQVEELRRASLQEAEDQELQHAYETIQQSVQQIKQDIRRDIAKMELTAKQDVLRQREQYKQQIFKHVAEKLQEYVKTNTYREYLTSTLSKVIEDYGSESVEIFVAPFDEWLAERSERGSYPITVDRTIQLGGLYLVDSAAGILVDETLDTKLKDQNEYFNANFNLSAQS